MATDPQLRLVPDPGDPPPSEDLKSSRSGRGRPIGPVDIAAADRLIAKLDRALQLVREISRSGAIDDVREDPHARARDARETGRRPVIRRAVWTPDGAELAIELRGRVWSRTVRWREAVGANEAAALARVCVPSVHLWASNGRLALAPGAALGYHGRRPRLAIRLVDLRRFLERRGPRAGFDPGDLPRPDADDLFPNRELFREVQHRRGP